MPVDEVLDRSRIEFKHDMDLSTAKDLLEYIARKAPAEIEIRSSQSEMMHASYEDPSEFSKRRLDVALGGVIKLKDNPMAYDSFTFQKKQIASLVFTSMQFILIPELDHLSDYERVVPVWDKTREQIKKYFE